MLIEKPFCTSSQKKKQARAAQRKIKTIASRLVRELYKSSDPILAIAIHLIKNNKCETVSDAELPSNLLSLI